MIAESGPHRDARSLASETLDRILAAGLPADEALQGPRELLEARDRALFDQLTRGTLRWLRRLDQILESASGRSLARIDQKLLAPLRIGAYQLLFLERVPAHAAVNEAVEEVKRRGLGRATGFANGVLRRIARAPQLESWPVEDSDVIRRLAIEQSHPDWMVQRWAEQFGVDRTHELVLANNRPRPMTLLTFRDAGGRDGAREALAAEGVETHPSALSPLGLLVERGDPMRSQSFARGSIYVQDAASQLAAWIPRPREGERVLDLAAAPGGKSLSLLAWEPRVHIVAADLSLSRLELMRQNLLRTRRRVPLLVTDAGQPAIAEAFDRVIVDLPCSGTGTLRKNPELKWRLKPEALEGMSRRGLEIADAAAQCVRPGGLLCIVTCSIEPEENEQMVSRLLERRSDLAPVSLAGMVPESAEAGVFGPGAWRLLPADQHDGFTVHVVRRRPSDA